MLYTPLIAELGVVILWVAVAYAGFKVYGREKALFFIGGSILWTSIIENLGVLEGSYTYYTFAGVFGKGYPGYALWVGMVPLWIELGWIIVALSLFILLHEVLLTGRNPYLQALCAGILAVNIDAMMDPIAVANHLWMWLNPSIYIMGVPLYNWIGWFFLIFFYDLTFNFTIMNNKPVFLLGTVEKMFLKGTATLRERTASFAFRIVVTNFFVALVLTAIAVGLQAVAGGLAVG